MSAMNDGEPLRPESLEAGSDRHDHAALLARFLPAEEPQTPSRSHHVTAVLVSHNGAPWLDRAVDALSWQQRPPEVAIAIDAGSADESLQLLSAAEATGVFGEVRSVAAANWAATANEVTHLVPADSSGGESVRWLWLLHDDCAPEPDCLAELLAHTDRHPATAVVGPKVVGWADSGRLIDAGRLWAPGSPQVARVERGERDQGQRDHPVAVYALGSAGLLVRVDLLAELGGFDADAPGDAAAADLCRRARARGHEVWLAPQAVVAHRRAGEMCVRLGSNPAGQRRAARAAQAYLDLTQAPAVALPWRWLRAAVTTTLRGMALLVTRDPQEAVGEFRGVGDVLCHPGRLLRARARLRAGGGSLTRPPELRASRWAVARHTWDSWNAASAAAGGTPVVSDTAAPSGPRWLLAVVLSTLTVAALIANSELLLGPGSVQGGGLLPSAGANDLFARYWRDWHEVGFGSARATPIYLPLLGVLAVPLLGSADLLLRILLGLYVPLAFVVAYLALGQMWPRPLRIALGAGYALLPAGLAGSASGRLSTVAVGLLGPPVVRVIGAAVRTKAPAHSVIWGGLLAGVLASFAPAVWLVLPLVAVGHLVRTRGARAELGRRWLLGLGCAAAVNAPWLPELLHNPALTLFEVGVNSPGLLGDMGRGWALGLSPGGLGAPPIWAGVPLLLLALGAAWWRPSAAALRCLTVGLGGLAVAALSSAVVLPVPWAAPAIGQHSWPGQWLQLSGAAFLLAIGFLASARDVRGGRRVTAPGWLVGGALVAALALTGGWAAASPGATTASADAVMPAVAAAAATSAEAPRVLLLRRDPVTDAVGYYVSAGAGARLGDADVASAGPLQEKLDSTVAGMVAAAGLDVAGQLAPRAIGYVVFTGAADDPVISALDSAVGLRRLSSGSNQALWLVIGHAARAQLAPAAALPDDEPVMVPVRAEGQPVIAVVLHPDLRFPRRLAFAERMSRGWHIDLAGTGVPVTPDPATGLVQADLGGPGVLTVEYRGWRGVAVSLQLGLLAALMVLGLPKRRRLDPDSVPAASELAGAPTRVISVRERP